MLKSKIRGLIFVASPTSGRKQSIPNMFSSLLLVRYRQWSYVLGLSLNNFTIATSSVFITHPQDQFIHINEDAVFECVANGSESLTINWTRSVETSSRLKTSNIITNGGKRSILQVKKSRIADSGFYWCIATNADNKVVSSKPAELLST